MIESLKLERNSGLILKMINKKNYSESITAEANYTRESEKLQEPEIQFQENSYIGDYKILMKVKLVQWMQMQLMN
jgi:hypothetical protein